MRAFFRRRGLGWFDLAAGIRQGCPLSPLLFAVILDPFLRLLQRRLPDALCRAYADDNAVALSDAFQNLPALHMSFQELAKVANLNLNMPKTICIPLWQEPLDRISAQLAAACPPWSDIEVARKGKYLGFWVGPEKGCIAWQDAGRKMVQRSDAWAWRELGLFYSTIVYNSYIASIPMFIAQLEPYP